MEIYERLVHIVDAEKQGLFHPDREKDQLTTAIGTPEHCGRVREVSSSLPWKQAFPNDSGYRKHDRYKKDLEEKDESNCKRRILSIIGQPVGILCAKCGTS